MLQHYLLITCRNLRRHKGSFLINLLGLSAGLACTFLIYLWVNDELHFDKFHAKDAQLYQVMERNTENGVVQIHDGVQGPLPEAMKRDLPEVTDAVGVMSLQKEGIYLPVRNGDKVVKTSGLMATGSFFKMFSFPLVSGQADKVLMEKQSVVISQQMAQQLFGSVENAVGRQIEWELFGHKTPAMVTGVFAPVRANSTFQFDFVMSLDFDGISEHWKRWENSGPAAYVTLKEGTDIDKFDAKIKNYLGKYTKENIFTLFTRPFSNGYLYGDYVNGVVSGGRIAYVKLFSLIAVFILLIACINFMNLSTARASRRLKEVGVKKAIGASRHSLVFQFLAEALCMAVLALIVATLMVVLFLPQFNLITGKQLVIHFTPSLVLTALGIAVAAGLISGSYPAFYLSGFDPVGVLKGRLKTQVGELIARKGLVVFQFTISLVLIIAVVVIYRQVQYVQGQHVGYNKENVIYFDVEGNLQQNGQSFIAALKQLPGVVNASGMQGGMLESEKGGSTFGISWPGKDEKEIVKFIYRGADFNLLQTMGIQVKEGRDFNAGFGGEDNKVIFNESAIKAMGLKHPVGTEVVFWGEKSTIIGVVKDFHMSSLHDPIQPMVFSFSPEKANTILVKIKGDKLAEGIAEVERLYKQFNPGYIFGYKFLDDSYKAQYVGERRVAALSRYFAGLAILISCLGLFGLAAFNAEIRTKEMGIRKILGASVSNVVMLLSKDFIKLILMAIALAFPLSWWLMSRWLNNYAYHINIGVGVFFIAGVSIIVIAMLTIMYQSLKAAITNPVKSLKSE